MPNGTTHQQQKQFYYQYYTHLQIVIIIISRIIIYLVYNWNVPSATRELRPLQQHCAVTKTIFINPTEKGRIVELPKLPGMIYRLCCQCYCRCIEPYLTKTTRVKNAGFSLQGTKQNQDLSHHHTCISNSNVITNPLCHRHVTDMQ